jgi:hypothetical protein
MFHIQYPKDLENGFTSSHAPSRLQLPSREYAAFSAPPESPTVHDDQREIVTDTSYGAELKFRLSVVTEEGNI